MIKSTFKIGIVSHNRENNLKTLSYLKEIGFLKDEIIICVNADEFDRYNTLHSKDAQIISSEVKGVARARNTILNKCSIGSKVLLMDDDVTQISYLSGYTNGGELKKVVTKEMFVKLFSMCFDTALRRKAYMFGIYPIDNDYFMKPTVDEKNIIVGACMGLINEPSWRFDESYRLKDDYELSLRMMKHGYNVLRFNYITMSTVYYAKGGCFETHSLYEGEVAKRLQRTYPSLVKPHPKRPDTDIRFIKPKKEAK